MPSGARQATNWCRRPFAGMFWAVTRLRLGNILILLAIPPLIAAGAPLLAAAHWAIDNLACFPAQAFAALLAAAVGLALLRRRWAAAVCALGALVAGAHVLPLWLTQPPAAAPGERLRVLTINLLRENQDVAAVLARIRDDEPDIVFCSELTTAWWRALEPQLPAFPHRCHQTDDGWFGVALWSRRPLVAAAVLPMGYGWAPAIRAEVAFGSGRLGLLGIHPPRPGNGRRCGERDQALAALPELLAGLPPARVVLGDANATPWNHSFRRMLSATGLQLATIGGWCGTWPSGLPWPLRIPIDHVLVSEAVGVHAVRVCPELGSDHLPVFAEIGPRALR